MKTNFTDRQSGAVNATHADWRHGMRGFSLIELITTVSILSIMLAIAVPSFSKMISDNRMLAGANSLAAGITFAKSQAVKLARPVTICPSTDGTGCNGTLFDQGWVVVVDTISDVATAPALDTTLASIPGGILMTSGKMENSAVTKTNQAWVRFLPRGTATEVSTITVKPSGTCNTSYSWQQVDVGIAGRVSITKKPC
ncbi:MAG TPA: GspH/FimT family pseudopilin [Pseudomonadales bacterium]|nr:GspH/FimT family pseudopilin [Pseudomonadales bacterium]